MSAAVLERRYPTLAAVMAVDAGGAKRDHVLRAIAAFQDEGHEPSLREIAERAQLERGWRQAQQLVLRLERDGLLRVEWARPGWRRGEKAPRNRYEILLRKPVAA